MKTRLLKTLGLTALTALFCLYCADNSTNGDGTGGGEVDNLLRHFNENGKGGGGGSTFVDRRDGKTYKQVAIGGQVWMAENLNYNASGSVCYDSSAANCDTYGRLYNWNTAMNGSSSSSRNPSGVRGVCPEGWHLPSDAEWDVLVEYVGDWPVAGTKLKSSTGWNAYSGVPFGTDEYGFSALPGGYGYSDGSFYSAGSSGYWWSAAQDYASHAWFLDMHDGGEGVYKGSDVKTGLFSVRCVQDP